MKLNDFVKKNLTIEEKVKLISAWEEDRGSDGENVYDLDDDKDADNWISLYGVKELYICRKEGRFWLGGWQFNCHGTRIDRFNKNFSAWCITEETNMDFFIDEIESRYEDYLKENDDYQPEEVSCAEFSKMYYELIDFVAFYKATHHKYMWIGKSNDGSYDVKSAETFDNKKDCYNDMRNAVLEKMKWNTEFDVDLTEYDYVRYDVTFCQDKIVHQSYGGTYTYKIISVEM